MHPKVKGGVADEIMRNGLSNYMEIFIKKINYVKNEDFKNKAKEFVENMITRVINFGLFRESWFDFKVLILSACELNNDKFLKFILERIQIGLKEDSFKKLNLLNYLEAVAGRVCQSATECESLYWMIPAMLRRLENTSDTTEIFKIYDTMSSIFEYFIDLETGKTSFEHLVRIKDDIDESAIRLFSHFMRKGKDFKVSFSQINSILMLGEFVLGKVMKKFEDEFLDSYDSLTPQNFQILISLLFKRKPEKVEELILNWMNRKALKKLNQPKSVEGMKLEKVLKSFGINEIEYSLKSSNENILSKYIAIVSSISRNSLEISDQMLIESIKFMALCFESDKKVVVRTTIAAFKLYFNSFEFLQIGTTSKDHVKNTVKNQLEKIEHIEFIEGEQSNYPRVKQLFESFLISLVETVDSLMNQILEDGFEPLAYSEGVFEIFKDGIREKEQAEDMSHLKHPKIDPFCDTVLLLNGFLNKDYTFYQLLKSPKFCTFIDSFKTRVLGFLKKSHLFELDKIKASLLFLLTFEASATNSLFEKPAKEKVLTMAHRYATYSKHFNQMPVRNQIGFAKKYACTQFRLRALLSSPVQNFESGDAGISVFDDIVGDNEYLKSLELKDFEVKDNGKFFVFGNLFNGYFIENVLLNQFYYNSPLAFIYNSNSMTYKFIFSLTANGPYNQPAWMADKALDTLLELLKLECHHEGDFTNIVTKVVAITFAYFLENITTVSQQAKISECMNLISTKGNKAKCFPIISVIAEYMLKAANIKDFGSEEDRANKKTELLLSFENLEIVINNDLCSLISLVTNFITSTNLIKNDPDLLKSAIFNFGLALNTKEISKRVLISVGLSYAHYLLNKLQLRIEETNVDCDNLADENGYILESQVLQINKEIRKGLGFLKEGSAVESVQNEFQFLTPEYLPNVEPSYRRAPYKFEKVCFEKITEFDENEGNELAIVYKEYIKSLVLESMNMESKAYKSLRIGYGFMSKIFNYRREWQVSLNESTKVFRLTSTALIQNYGVNFFRKVLPLFEELRNESNENLISVQKLEQEFLVVAMYTAGYSFGQEDFEEVVSTSLNVIRRNYMNPLFNNLQVNLMVRLTWAFRNCYSCARLMHVTGIINQFYDSTNDKEKRNMLMNMYSSVLGASRQYFDEETKEHLKKALDISQLSSLGDYSKSGSVQILLQQSSSANSYSLNKLKTHLNGNIISTPHPENDIQYAELSSSDDFNLREVSLSFLTKISSESVMVRASTLKVFMAILYGTADLLVTHSNYELSLKLVELVFSLDSNEEESAKKMVMAVQPYLSKVFTGFLIDSTLRDRFMDDLEKIYENLKGVDKISIFFSGYCIFCSIYLTPKRLDFLAKALGNLPSKLVEKGNSSLLYPLSRVPDSLLEEFANYISEKLSNLEIK
jgi:hypothetical protein